MKELTAMITARLDHMVESGKVQELIDTQLNKTMTDVLSDSLKSYSDFGKQVKEKLEASLNNAIDKVSFPEYSKFITDQVVAATSEKLNAAASESLQEQLKGILEPVAKVMKPSELLHEIGSHFDHDSSGVEFEDGPYIPVEWDINDDETAITLKIKGDLTVRFYDFRNKNEWFIGYIEDDMERVITKGIQGATQSYGAAGWLYKAYCTGTIFPDLHVSQEDYISL
jgi:hypothetical protein